MVSSATNHEVAGIGKFRRKSLVPKRLSIGSKGVVSGELANGYVHVEEFCAEHLDKLREFLVSVFEECRVAKVTLQRLK